MSSEVNLMFNLRDGEFQIKAGSQDIPMILDRIEHLLSQFWQPIELEDRKDQDEITHGNGDNRPSGNGADQSVSTTPPQAPKKRRGDGKSRPAKWQIIELGISSEQMGVLREFYASKKPIRQNDQAAVVGVKLKELLKRDTFDGNEIASGLRIVGAKIPRNLPAVFANIRGEGFGDYREGKLLINIYTEDHVSHGFAKAESKNK